MWCCKFYAHQVTVYTRNLLKSTMLQPLKGEVGYKLAASKWLKTPTQAPLAFNCQIDLMVLFKVNSFFHPSMADNVIACRSIISHIPQSTAFTISFPKLIVLVFSRESE